MLMAHGQTVGHPVRGRAVDERRLVSTAHQPVEDVDLDHQTNRLVAAAQTDWSRPTRRLDRGLPFDRAPSPSALSSQPPELPRSRNRCPGAPLRTPPPGLDDSRRRQEARQHPRPLPRRPRRGPRRRDRCYGRRRTSPSRRLVRHPWRHRRASALTTEPPTSRTSDATPAPSSEPSTHAHDHAARRPTAKSSAFTARWPTAGAMAAATSQRPNGALLSPAGCTPTTTPGRTPPSGTSRPSNARPTSRSVHLVGENRPAVRRGRQAGRRVDQLISTPVNVTSVFGFPPPGLGSRLWSWPPRATVSSTASPSSEIVPNTV